MHIKSKKIAFPVILPGSPRYDTSGSPHPLKFGNELNECIFTFNINMI